MCTQSNFLQEDFTFPLHSVIASFAPCQVDIIHKAKNIQIFSLDNLDRGKKDMENTVQACTTAMWPRNTSLLPCVDPWFLFLLLNLWHRKRILGNRQGTRQQLLSSGSTVQTHQLTISDDHGHEPTTKTSADISTFDETCTSLRPSSLWKAIAHLPTITKLSKTAPIIGPR